MNTEDIFWELGGALTVNSAIDPFFNRIMSDDLLTPFFENLPLDHQLKTRKMVLMLLFGGTPNYNIANLRNSHRSMVESKGLSDKHFDAILRHLRDTLVEIDIKPELIDEVLERAELTRNDVLCR